MADATVTDDELGEMFAAMRRHTAEGDPVKAFILQDHITNRTHAPKELLYFGEIHPTRESDEAPPDMPPRHSVGATKAAWVDFAKRTSDLEHEIIDSMGRNDIIKALEAQGVIPREEKQPDFYDEN